MAEKTNRDFLLYGWDDGKVYFWDEQNKQERCVSDDEALYDQLVKICEIYFREKTGKDGG